MTREQYTSLVELYKDDPIGFIEELIIYERAPVFGTDNKTGKRVVVDRGVKIHIGEQQKEIFRGAVKAIKEKKGLSCKSGRGIGKTCAMSWLALWFLFTREQCKVACTAPTEKQIKQGLWEELKRWIDLSPLLSETLLWTSETIKVKNFEDPSITYGGWQIELRTCFKRENVSGVHGANGTLFIIDEAAGIQDDDVWDGIEGCTTDKGSLMVMVGNPSSMYNRFYDSHHLLKDEYVRITLSAEHSDYRGDTDVIKKWAKKYGVNSNTYRINVKGEFPLSDPDTFISEDELEPVWNRFTPRDVQCPIIAIDPSDSGDDCTEIVCGNGAIIHHWKTIYGKQDSKKIVDNVVKLVYDMRSRSHELGFHDTMQIDVILDSNGIGVGTRDGLMQKQYELNIKVIENKSSQSGDAFYETMKDLLWGVMRDMLKRLCIEYNPKPGNINTQNNLKNLDFKNELMTQVCSRKCHVSQSSAKMVIETKESLKKRGLSSPDKGDALSLYCYRLQQKVFRPNAFRRTTSIKMGRETSVLG